MKNLRLGLPTVQDVYRVALIPCLQRTTDSPDVASLSIGEPLLPDMETRLLGYQVHRMRKLLGEK